ncbi:hypothetical protein ACFX15_045578 [Malus domestica]
MPSPFAGPCSSSWNHKQLGNCSLGHGAFSCACSWRNARRRSERIQSRNENTIRIIVARLLVLPLIGIDVVLFSDKLNLLVADDQFYRFVLLLQYTKPSAILLGAVASLRGYVVEKASPLLLW